MPLTAGIACSFATICSLATPTLASSFESNNLGTDNPTIEILLVLKEGGKLSKELLSEGMKSPSYVKAKALIEEKSAARGISIRWTTEATAQDLITAMGNPRNLGIIMVGESALKYIDTGDEENPINVYDAVLLDSNESYIPKLLPQAAHANLQFLGLNVCYFTAIEEYYKLTDGKTSFEVLNPFPFSREVLDQQPVYIQKLDPVPFQKILFNKISAQLDSYLAQYEEDSAKQPSTDKHAQLTILYRDLKSTKVKYTVKVNDVLVGVLNDGFQEIGGSYKVASASAEAVFSFPASLLGANNQLSIQPDDPSRKVNLDGTPSSVDYAVDDILVTSIELSRPLANGGTDKIELISEMVHIGDKDPLDSKIKLSFKENHADLIKTEDVFPSLEVPFR